MYYSGAFSSVPVNFISKRFLGEKRSNRSSIFPDDEFVTYFCTFVDEFLPLYKLHTHKILSSYAHIRKRQNDRQPARKTIKKLME